ncbi:MAG TPA: phosphatase PAP2 family protein [Aquabacterium sp.]|nr:phosphatase PAP2 family protein [Aquabacterium sp.]HQC98205.1 phosphatase PAP2 family protein [Aquabacterium sp.]
MLRPALTAPALATLTLVALSGCQTAPPARPAPPTDPDVVGESRTGSGYLKGYLDRKQLPDSLALLPRPPAEGSAEAAADLAVHRATRALRDTPRWALAASDDNLKFPKAAEVFSCALDLPISPDATPHLNMLLRRTLLDAGLSTYGAKDHYKRQRPFAALNEGTCAPASEAALRNDGSYPSGHSALGWAWALVLTGIAPDRADALLQRGHAFGQSRVVCGVHWQSDVDNGRVMGAAAVARLQSDPTFTAQAALARQEIADARAKGARSPLNCAAEQAALGR